MSDERLFGFICGVLFGGNVGYMLGMIRGFYKRRAGRGQSGD